MLASAVEGGEDDEVHGEAFVKADELPGSIEDATGEPDASSSDVEVHVSEVDVTEAENGAALDSESSSNSEDVDDAVAVEGGVWKRCSIFK